MALADHFHGKGRAFTYAELHTAAESVAAQLAAVGLRSGDRVLIFHPVSAELYIMLFALFRLGLIAVFVDPGQTREFIARCCEVARPQGFLGSPKAHLLRLMHPAIRRIPRALYFYGWVPMSQKLTWAIPRPAVSPSPVDPDAATLITFTSGSTGAPKAIARSQRFLLAQHAALESSITLKPREIDLATLPVLVLANLASGLSTVLAHCDLGNVGLAHGPDILAQINEQKVSRLAASPAFMQCLLTDRTEAPTMRKLFTGGAPVFPGLMEALQARFPHAAVVAVYGSSEAEPIAHVEWKEMLPEDLDAMRSGAGLLAGHCVAEIKVAILNIMWEAPMPSLTAQEFESHACRPEQIGEILVSGAHVVQGYWHGVGDAETKCRVADVVWHRTGDAGYFDARGRLWLVGRGSARMTHSDGTSLWPFQLETLLSFIPEIRRSALVECEGKRYLCVEGHWEPVWREKLTPWDVAEVFLTSIPLDKRHRAKVDYPALKRRVAELVKARPV